MTDKEKAVTSKEKQEPIRLNLGDGGIEIPGYTGLDRKRGEEVFPLRQYADGTVDEIRASHILEHFGFREVPAVLAEWARVLKPGGRLRIAVPNALWISEQIVSGQAGGRADPNCLYYLMGAQSDQNDFHASAYTPALLENLLVQAGFERIGRWQADAADCSSLEVSLNLEGYKRPPSETGTPKQIRTIAVMSIPRLTFSDNIFCAMESFVPLGIPIKRHTGVFWSQCLSRCFEDAIRDGFDWVITVDYDTIFTTAHVQELLRLAALYPDADAISPVQIKREDSASMLAIYQEDGKPREYIPFEEFEQALTRVTTAHFGLTLLRLEKFKNLEKPWFWSKADASGGWGEGHVDEDIYFWQNWARSGNTLYMANRIHIGHMQLMVTWPGHKWRPQHQYASEWNNTRMPPKIVIPRSMIFGEEESYGHSVNQSVSGNIAGNDSGPRRGGGGTIHRPRRGGQGAGRARRKQGPR